MTSTEETPEALPHAHAQETASNTSAGRSQPPQMTMQEAERAVAETASAKQAICDALAHKIVGQKDVIDALLISLFAKGHCLFSGVPGLAKTLLVSTLASLTNLSFSRIQFTPDLMPSDITGTEILEEDKNTGRRSFRFVQGPVFANLILADEINRTPPKTQAALLQAMQEGRVTANGITHALPAPFFVFATQNPIEQEGTYPLPEAQLDRFMFFVEVGYPSLEEELEIVRSTTAGDNAAVPKVLSPERLMTLQALVPQVPASESVIRAAVTLVQKTRPDSPLAPDFVKKSVSWGAGPRASQFLILGAKARALLNGRFACTVDDIKALARPVLRHRMVTNFQAESEGIGSGEIIDLLLKEM